MARAPGKRPQPTKMKIIKGTLQNCRANKNEATPPPDLPAVPRGMTGAAKAEWLKMAPLLYDLGLLSTIDTTALEAYCRCYGLWADAMKSVKKEGATVVSSKGYPIQNPNLKTAMKCSKELQSWLTEFGMTPASRARVPAKAQPKKTGFAALNG